MDQPNQPQAPQEPQGRLTKHELRTQRREERKAEQRAHDTKRTTKRVIMWSVIVFVLGLVVWGMYAIIKGGPATPSGPVAGVNDILPDDHVTGNVDATNATLVEYGDFQCPACGAYHPIVVKVLKDFGTKTRFVFRNYPLPQHNNARVAARAAGAAATQNKFWEMHDKLYETQTVWSDFSDSKARDTFAGYAKDLGLNVDQFKKDIDDAAIKAKIDKDVASGTRAGVDSTPTFYLNGSKISPQSYDDFKKLLDAIVKP